MTGVLLPQPIGARVLQLVSRSPRLRRIDVRISAADTRSPIGRTRIFRLTDHDFEQLIATAERFEAR